MDKIEQIQNTQDLVFASVILRILATLIDYFIILIVSLLIIMAFNYNSLVKLILGFILIFSYSICSIIGQTFWGTTIGKYFMKIEVLKKDFNKADFYTMIKKYSIDLINDFFFFITQLYIFFEIYKKNNNLNYVLDNLDIESIKSPIIKVIAFIFVSYRIIKLLTCLLDSKNRSIHDIIAGTIVVKCKK